MSLRDSILKTRNAADVPLLPVATPEWPDVDGKLFVKMLSACEADSPTNDDEEDVEVNYRAKHLCRVLCDENRNRVLQDDDAAYLGHKELSVVNRLFRQSLAYQGLTKEDREDKRKNLPNAENDGSPSCSPEPSIPATVST